MIECRRLYVSFEDHSVLRGLDLDVAEGESMVVIGGSGQGKSVLIKNIIGLMLPDSGSVVIEGRDIATLHRHELIEFRRKFGMLFQGAALFDSLKVRENVAFGLLEHGRHTSAEIDRVVREKLEMVGLGDIGHLWPAELSGGMKKRVGLARAIALEPKILLYDEPTTGLDPITADAINQLIVDLRERLRITSVAITHDMTSAYKIADKIAMLYDGRIIQVGTPDEIRRTENPFVRQFITGSSVGPIKVH